jgi:hypothetical protein
MPSQDTTTRRKTHKHGRSRSTEYCIWRGMLRRCYGTTSRAYRFYGARGVTVCDSWREDFRNFFADMGERPSLEYTLDRINTYGPYSPENCRWATRKQQANNTRANAIITFNGKTMSVTQWAETVGISPITLSNRLKRGWSIARAMSGAAHSAPRKVREFQLLLPRYCWCGKRVVARDLCGMHYARGREAGTLAIGSGRVCACGKPHYAKGMCRKCYAKVWWSMANEVRASSASEDSRPLVRTTAPSGTTDAP